MILTAGFGCGPGGKIAAVVNGQVITEQDLQQRSARLSPSYLAALGNDQQRLLDEMIMETLLVQEARRRGLDRDSEVQRLLKEASRQILLGRLLEVIRTNQKVEISEEEMARFYDLNRNSFVEPEGFRASHILVDTEEAAKKALARLKAGEDFAQVAQEVSIDTTKSRGGDIGPFTKGQLIPEFEAACEGLKPGELSPVVKSSLGFHVILLTERKASRQKSLEEVREPIRSQLVAQRQQREVETFAQELRAKAQIRTSSSKSSSAPGPSAQAQGATQPP